MFPTFLWDLTTVNISRTWRLSFAECFCAGLAQEKEATLVTCDRGFEGLEREGKTAVLWLPLERRDS